MVGPSASSLLDDEGGQHVAQVTPQVDKAARQGPLATFHHFEPLSLVTPGLCQAEGSISPPSTRGTGKGVMRKAEYELILQVHKRKVEAEKEVKLQRLEIDT